MNALLEELHQRGLLADCTDLAGLSQRLDEGSCPMYVGFDPTADSLHVGSLMPLAVARTAQRHGHVPVLLIGGATGMIGDPSGRSTERNLLDDGTLDANRRALQQQIVRLMSDERAGENAPVVVDNRDWIAPMSAIELLRDVGRHFSVNQMLGRDSVRLRRESEGGLSFTEFSYQLLQAFDFWWLRKHKGVEVQLGGSDQWGNITAGTDFMRRVDGSRGWGLVWPLLTKSDGGKFGKTADGNVWLDPARTSAFEFWQFWFNTDDADVKTMLLRFTSISPAQIELLVERHEASPERREAQRTLADHVTAWVHGSKATEAAAHAAAFLFGLDVELDAETAEFIAEQIGAVSLDAAELAGRAVTSLAIDAGLCTSNGEARRLAAAGGLRLWDVPVDAERRVATEDIRLGGWLLLSKGRRSRALVRVTGAGLR